MHHVRILTESRPAKNSIGFLLMTDWSSKEDEAVVRDAARKVVDAAGATAKKNGSFLEFKYSNYASRDQDPHSTYGLDNLSKLKRNCQGCRSQGNIPNPARWGLACRPSREAMICSGCTESVCLDGAERSTPEYLRIHC